MELYFNSWSMNLAFMDVGARRKGSKVRGTSLPQEYALVKFLANVTHDSGTWSTHTPACAWNGISCDGKDRVVEIRIGGEGLSGTLDVSSLPASLLLLNTASNKLCGSVAFCSLPGELQQLILRYNFFTGLVDLTRLPFGLQSLSLQSNRFSGTIDLASLPPTLHSIYLGCNNLDGGLDLSSLPRTLRDLYLNDNNFTGLVDCSRLPTSLKTLQMSRTQIRYDPQQCSALIQIYT